MMIATFGLRLAAGMVLGLLLIPSGVVAERFYRIHLIIVLCLVGVVSVFAWADAPEAIWLPLGVAGGAALFGAWAWSIEAAGGRYAALIMALVALLGALWFLPAEPASPGLDVVGMGADIASAAYLGLALTAMLLGHWYLIAPNLSIAPLLRLLAGLLVATGVRALTVAISLGLATAGRFDFDYVGWLWLLLRVLAGLILAPALFYMARESARIRSTQSATGILYAGCVLAMMGELTDQLLMAHVTVSSSG